MARKFKSFETRDKPRKRGPLQEYMLRGWEILELASDYFWIIILTIVGGSFGSSGITKFLKKK